MKTLPGFVLCLLLLACNFPADTPPEGSFLCMGYHNGLSAASGEIVLYPDGTFNFNTYEGTWEYNADTHELTFAENIYLAAGMYSPDGKFLVLTLKPDAPVTHAETGQITCAPREETLSPGN